MTTPSSSIEDTPPASEHLTDYDRRHLKTYARLLDAAADQADWREVASIVLGLDPVREPEGARRVYDAHFARAYWMTTTGHRDLVERMRPH